MPGSAGYFPWSSTCHTGLVPVSTPSPTYCCSFLLTLLGRKDGGRVKILMLVQWGERQGCSWHTHKVCAVYIGDLSLLLGQTLALHRERNQTKGQERSITGFSLEGGVSLHG